MMPKSIPSFSEEKQFWEKGIHHVIGIDEVGRGCFAGPVVVGGVIFHPHAHFDWLEDINDSKLLTAKKRELLAPLIREHSFAYHICEISVETINEIGIGKATFLGMKQVCNTLSTNCHPELVSGSHKNNIGMPNQAMPAGRQVRHDNYKGMAILVDAFTIPNITLPQKAIVKGDQKCLSIAAASIIAKVYRDNLMTKLAQENPRYGFEIHKGYGTKQHRDAIKQHGLSPLHRTNFSLEKYI